jgi:hypothetical protein
MTDDEEGTALARLAERSQRELGITALSLGHFGAAWCGWRAATVFRLVT